MRARPLRAAALAVLAALLLALPFVVDHAGRIAAGMKAKSICSGVFVSGRSAAAVEREDLAPYGSALLDAVAAHVDPAQPRVAASLLGLGGNVAAYRQGLGCTLTAHTPPDRLAAQVRGLDLSPRAPAPLPVAPPDAARDTRLASVVNAAFVDPSGTRTRRTRAVIVLHDGQVVAERYADGVTAETPLQGWSMTKSVAAALVGIRAAEGGLALDAPAPVPEWRARPDDPRAAITLRQLLQMSSGLAFDEQYGHPFADVMRMLFAEASAGAFAAQRPLAYPPGTHWAYASGTANIVARILAQSFASPQAALAYPRRALFDRIGMTGAVIEPDVSGAFVGSSFMLATARDSARFGWLHAQDGMWEGERVLPEGWVAFVRTPAPAAPKAEYGAHWWLRLDTPSGSDARLPPDAFHAAGHGGQFVTVVPSRGVVVVRLGLTLAKGAWDQPAFVADVLDALGPAH
jgi:CubicO group peptidase (beta-lactamase class C family)